MKYRLNKGSIKLIFTLSLLWGCREPQVVVIPDNDPPPYTAVPIIVVENYINRLFIDLIGREPVQNEKQEALVDLLGAGLSFEARESLILRLQTAEDFVPVDTNYRRAYSWRLYELGKERIIEGASEEWLAYRISRFEEKAYEDSLKQDPGGVAYAREEQARLEGVREIPYLLRDRQIDHREMFARLIQNYVYDDINKGSFNFINASFEDLLGRFPTEAEYAAAFDVIEFNQPGVVLGEACKNKAEYSRVMTQSREFAESMIRWTYQTLLARQPEADEIVLLMARFYEDQDYEYVQRTIMMTDEYARF